MMHQRLTIDISIFIFLIFSTVNTHIKSEMFHKTIGEKKPKSFPGLLGLITVKTSKRILDSRPHIYDHKDIVYTQH